MSSHVIISFVLFNMYAYRLCYHTRCQHSNLFGLRAFKMPILRYLETVWERSEKIWKMSKTVREMAVFTIAVVDARFADSHCPANQTVAEHLMATIVSLYQLRPADLNPTRWATSQGIMEYLMATIGGPRRWISLIIVYFGSYLAWGGMRARVEGNKEIEIERIHLSLFHKILTHVFL